MTTSNDQATHPGTEREVLYFDSATVDDEGRSHSWRTHVTLTCPVDGGNGCLLVLVPGGTYGADYWDLDYRPEIYSFVRWATRAGYSTANVDRVGSEASGRLPAMVVTGAATYVAAALMLCRGTARDLLGLLKKALHRE